jgi:hypothetical protein
VRKKVAGAGERAGRDCGRLAVNIRSSERAQLRGRASGGEGEKIQGRLSTAGMASATMHSQRRRQQQCGLQLQRRSGRKGSSAGEVGDMW